MLLLALVGAAFASEQVNPSVIVHHGRQLSAFDSEQVHVTMEHGAHRVDVPLGTLDLPVAMPGLLAVPGQLWLLNDHVWVEVVSADDALIEFAILD